MEDGHNQQTVTASRETEGLGIVCGRDTWPVHRQRGLLVNRVKEFKIPWESEIYIVFLWPSILASHDGGSWLSTRQLESAKT